MKVTFVSSRQDKAGGNIRHHLMQLLDADGTRWREQGRTYEFIEVDERLIHTEGIDKRTDAALIIFISRHSSVNPVPVLTVHVTGNYREAVLKAVNLGQDTDTTGAVTGALAGLYYGLGSIPEEWTAQLARKEDIEDLAERLARKLCNG